jgi:hypothetical protein
MGRIDSTVHDAESMKVGDRRCQLRHDDSRLLGGQRWRRLERMGADEAGVEGGYVIDVAAVDELDDPGMPCLSQDDGFVTKPLAVRRIRGSLARQHTAVVVDCSGDPGAHDVKV